jgi:hypothetical protein
MQIMEERCSDSVRVDILMFRRDARTLALQHPHSTVLSSANGAVSLRQRSQSYGGGSAGAPMTHVDWRDWVVLQDAYEPKLGIVKRTGTVDEETRLVWVASSPQCPKVCCTPTHARTHARAYPAVMVRKRPLARDGTRWRCLKQPDSLTAWFLFARPRHV